MKRRTVMSLASGVSLGAALPVLGQTPTRTRRVGSLNLVPDPKTPVSSRAFARELRKLGWSEGENVVVERAFADWKVERLHGLAEDMVRKGVELIFAAGPESAIAAARVTQSIPIVFVNVPWPVEQALIDSFARPGRNLTGTASYNGVDVTPKRLQFLREIAPSARRLSYLWPSHYVETVAGGRFDMPAVLDAAAKGQGFEMRIHNIQKEEDIDTAFREVEAWPAQAISAGGAHVFNASKRVAEFALRNRLPSAMAGRQLVDAGGLLSYGLGDAEYRRLYARAIDYVDRILRGARAADLPVEGPRQFEIVINLKTAKALGLAIPKSVLLRADHVIE